MLLLSFISLSAAAADILQSFYLELRQRNRSADAPPITTRQLESLVRLAEARARLELRETVTESDARDAVELMCALYAICIVRGIVRVAITL